MAPFALTDLVSDRRLTRLVKGPVDIAGRVNLAPNEFGCQADSRSANRPVAAGRQ